MTRLGRLVSGGLVAAGLAVAIGAPARADDPNIQRNTAVLRWLDKVTGRVQTEDVRVNTTTRIGTLEIIVRACVQHPPEDPPESAAFLDVSEVKPGQPTADVFRGWMFASSPALSAMEHPVYDLWVLDCKDEVGDAPAPTATPGTAPPAPAAAPAATAP